MRNHLARVFVILSFSFLAIFFDANGQADCNFEADPTLNCDPDAFVCSLLNFCSTMPPPTSSPFNVTICGQGIALNNPHWFGFIATSNNVVVTISPSNCNTIGNFSGLQGAIVTTCPTGVNYETIGNCVATPCATTPFTLQSNQFVVGQQYYILLDGCAGSQCDYQVTVASGLEIPSLEGQSPTSATLSGSNIVCPGEELTVTITNEILANNYEWTLSPGNIGYVTMTKQLSINTTGFAPGTYTVCLDNANNPCSDLIADDNYVSGSACFTFEVVPIPPVNVGNITVCFENLPYIRDGLSFNTPGPKTYTISSLAGCDSTITFNLSVIQNMPQDQESFYCPSSFPLNFPILGSVAAPGIYNVNYTDPFGCDSSYVNRVFSFIVDFSGFNPNATITCPGEDVFITASALVRRVPGNNPIFDANISYQWFNSAGQLVGTGGFLGTSIPGQYTLRAVVSYQGVECSEFETTFTVNEDLYDPPSPFINGNLSGCVEQVIFLSTNNWDGFSGIEWLSGTGYQLLGDPSQSSLAILLETPGQHQLCLRYFDPECPILESIECFVLNIGDELTLSIDGDLGFCQGGSTTITLEQNFPANQITWSTMANGSSINISTPGNYSVTVAEPAGCSGELNFTIVEFNEPVVSFTGSTAFCTGLSTNIGLTNTFNVYQWSNGASTPTINVNTPGLYSVTVTDQNGCTSENAITIQENDELLPTISGPTSFCEGTAITLSAGTFESYSWSLNNLETPTIQVNSPGTYTVTVTDESGCTGEGSIVISQNSNPEPSITGERDGICPGESLMMTAFPSGLAYSWSNGQTGPSITVSDSEEYFVTVTDSNGCIGISSFNFEPYELPSFLITGEDYFCETSSVTINVDASFPGFNWSNGEVTQEITINSAGTYTVTVTNEDGCESEQSIEILERQNPSESIDGVLAFCAGDETILSIQDIYEEYNWSTGSQSSSAIVNAGGLVTVEYVDEFGCVGSSSITVTQNALPQPVISGSTTFCVGLSTTLDGGNFVSYQWNDPLNTVTRELVVTSPGEYCLTVTDINGCIGIASCVTVIEDDELSFQIQGDRSYCAGSSTTLDPGVFAQYEWSTGSMSRLLQVTSPGTYTVQVSDADGCTGSASVDITENPLPTFSILGPASFCEGQTSTLEVSPGGFSGYLWSTGQSTRQISISEPGTYAVTVTDSNGCSSVQERFIERLSELRPTFSGDNLFCEGGSTVIDVVGGYETYLWQDNNSSNPQREFTSGGTYTVIVTDLSGCTGSGVITITEAPLPVADAGEDRVITCRDNVVTIGGSTTSTANVQINWIDLQTGMPMSMNNPTINVDRAGQFILQVTFNETGCSSQDTVSVFNEDNIIESAEIAAMNPLCFGESSGSLELLEITGGVAPFVYRLNGTVVTDLNLTELGPGTYNVEIEDANGCRYSESIILINPPQILIDLGENLVVDADEFVLISPDLNVPISQIDSIIWLFNDELLCANCPRLELEFLADRSGVLTIFVVDEFGCIGTDNIILNVQLVRNVFVPTGFTPNGDGINDRLRVFTSNNVSSIKYFRVFDRWGNVMFEELDLPPNDITGWDGTKNGLQLDPAVFIYSVGVEFEDGEEFQYSGEVNLLR